MTRPWRNSKMFVVIASVLVSAAIAISVGLAYPIPVASPALGADWQCHRTAGIVTTCHRISHVTPTRHHRLIQAVSALEA